MKKIFVIFVFLLSAFNAFADRLFVNDIALTNDDPATLDICFDNASADIVGLQFNLTLPEGMIPIYDGNKVVITPSNRLKGSYSLRGSKVSDGSYLFTFVSNDRTPIEGNSGNLFSISFQNSSATDGSYTANITNVITTDVGGCEYPLVNATISISVLHSYKLTYKIDGAVYKEYTLNYGDAITQENEPAMDGYSFSGWGEIPATMPAHDVEVNGSFTKGAYKLTYSVDGIKHKEYALDLGDVIIPEAEPAKEGYTFSGWSEIPATMPAHNVTVEGNFTVNKYKLTYMMDGEVFHEEEVEYGSAINPIEVPLREGETFSGWSTIPGTMPAHYVEVNGTFTINKYKVMFVSAGTVVKEETLDYGSPITAPADPTNIGHTFTGWNPTVDTTVPAHDVTYTAQFSVNQYTITFNTDGGSAVTPITQSYGTTITKPADPTKEGYTFADWNPAIPETMPAENMTIKALWTMNSYKLTYKVDGDIYKEYTLSYGEAITPEAEPTKEGYIFSGWSEIPATMPAYDVEVIGSFTKGAYKLTYYVDGVKYKELTYDFGDAITPEVEPTKEGHTFSGWSDIPATMPAHNVDVAGSFTINKYTIKFVNEDGSVLQSCELEYGVSPVYTEATPTKAATAEFSYTFAGWSPEIVAVTGDATYSATYTSAPNIYKLTYKVDGDVYKDFTLSYGEATTPEAEPAKEGHTFSGWSKIPATMPAHNVTVEGAFTVNKYKLIYMVDGEVFHEEEVEYGSAINPIEAPLREGETFSGWSTIPGTMPAHDVTISGTFATDTFILTYMVDGEVYNEQRVEYGTGITPLAEPAKEGYTFSGWSEVPETMPAHDVIIEGNYTVNKYKLTYRVDGDIFHEEEVEYGSAINPIEAPLREGETFSGWSTIPGTMPAHDITISGMFATDTFILTYMVDGEVYNEQRVEYRTGITPLAEPAKEGYTFSGWSEVPATMPAYDVAVEGNFTVNKYKLTYRVDGEVFHEEEVEYGSAINPIEAPLREGETFSGWSTIPGTMPAHDVTISGTFATDTFILTYMVDGEVYNEQRVEYGTGITPLAEPSKEGYTFSSWSEVPATMPAHDVEVTGSFVINTYSLTFTLDGTIYMSYPDVEYGSQIIAPDVNNSEYITFSGWENAPTTMPAHDVIIEGHLEYSTPPVTEGTVFTNEDCEIFEIAFNTTIKEVTEDAWAAIYLASEYKTLGYNATPLMISTNPKSWHIEGAKIIIAMDWSTNSAHPMLLKNKKLAETIEPKDYIFILGCGSIVFDNGSTNVTITEDVEKAIENIINSIEKAESITNKTVTAYDLFGRCIRFDGESATMPRIIIINGKKKILTK